MSSSYRSAALQISKGISADRISLQAQERYYLYLLDNVDSMVGVIDKKILELEEEKKKMLGQWGNATERIEEIRRWLKGLGIKKNKLLIEPKIDRFMKMREELIRMGEL